MLLTNTALLCYCSMGDQPLAIHSSYVVGSDLHLPIACMDARSSFKPAITPNQGTRSIILHESHIWPWLWICMIGDHAYSSVLCILSCTRVITIRADVWSSNTLLTDLILDQDRSVRLHKRQRVLFWDSSIIFSPASTWSPPKRWRRSQTSLENRSLCWARPASRHRSRMLILPGI